MLDVERLEQRISQLEEKVEQHHRQLIKLPAAIVNSIPQKSYYTTSELAKYAGKKAETIRAHCQTGRIRAERAATGHGRSKEYRISSEEVHQYLNMGLRPRPE